MGVCWPLAHGPGGLSMSTETGLGAALLAFYQPLSAAPRPTPSWQFTYISSPFHRLGNRGSEVKVIPCNVGVADSILSRVWLTFYCMNRG